MATRPPTGTVLADEMTIILPYLQADVIVLLGGIVPERKIVNATPAALLVYAGPFQSQWRWAGTAVQTLVHESAIYHSSEALAWVST